MGPLAVPATADADLRADALAGALAAADDVKAAGRAVIDHLAGLGLLPSFYLEQGGRLRCQAMRGYWQIFDGIPAGAGVIGRTWATGEPTVALDVTASEDYLEAAPAVVAEVCIPVRVGGRVVGALNAESRTPLGTPDVIEIIRAATLLAARLEGLGRLESPSPAEILARAGARLAALSEPAAIVAETGGAARDLSGFNSVMLAVAGPDGRLAVEHADGPFAALFSALDAGGLADIAGSVALSTSCYTSGEAAGLGFTGHEPVRAAGAATMVVLPLTAAGERLGILVLADERERTLATGEVELLELLAMQAAGGLRTAAAVRELRDRAARDALTGLGHHATFHAAIASLRASTPAGAGVAVVLADVDRFKDINDRLGHAAGDIVLRRVAAELHLTAPADAAAYRVGGDEFAVLAAVRGEEEALALADALAAAVRSGTGVTLSVGIAVGRAGEEDADLLARADTGMYAVKRAGRDGVALG
ncbi:MAG: diguanylate cyclase [Actinomycetota bacterium]|nr:diguanylate cyclase [Actinomycetota bacterium]